MDDESDDAFRHAIGCPTFGCHPADIARITSFQRAEKKGFRDVVLALEESTLPLLNKSAIIAARDAIEDLRARRASRSVLESLEQLLRTSGISAAAATMDPLDLAVIEEFFRYVKQCCLDRPSLTLQEFLSDLRFYAEEEYGQIRLTYQIPHLVISGVQLLTAHQSKGLEFHTVFLSGFREGHWDERSTKTSLAVPEDLLFGWEKDVKSFEKHQDERRVAYVAFTRAKRELFLLCPKEFSVGERTRAVSPSAFFAEAGPLPEMDAALKNPGHSSLMLFDPVRDLDTELRAYLLEKIETFALSPSTLATFLEDPQVFMRIHLLNQPQELTEESLRSMAYGSAVHWALRSWAESVTTGQPIGLDAFMEAVEWHLREKNILTEKQRDDLLGHAASSLPPYFAGHLEEHHPVIYAVEREYRAMLGDIPVKGKIDRIDRITDTSSDAIIIDFKTGRPKAPGEIRGPLGEGVVSRTREGALFRQLAFYALLIEQAEPLLVPQAFRLAFIGERGEEPIMRDFTITDPEKEDLKQLIGAVWKKIQNLDFTPLD